MREISTGEKGFASPKKEQVIVTGADGFIGRTIVELLLREGCRVRGLLETGSRYRVPLPQGMEPVYGDVLAPESLLPLFAGIDGDSAVLIHTAAVISVKKHNPYCERVNVLGTKNMLAAAKAHGIRSFVHLASVDALLPPEDGAVIVEPEAFSPASLPTAYARSKAAAAQLVLDSDLDYRMLLPSCVIGPGDYRMGFVSQMLRLYLGGMPRLSVAGGYEFVDVRDVAKAAVAAARLPVQRQCYLLSNRYADVTWVFNTLAQHLGRKPVQRTLPLGVLYPLAPLTAGACALVDREPPLTFAAIRLMEAHPAYSHAKAARELGFCPIPLEQSVLDAGDFLLACKRKAHRSV